MRTHKPLKADQILALRSAVPPVENQKRTRVTDGVVEPSSKRRRSNGVSHKQYEKLRKNAYGGESITRDVIKTDEIPQHDPWATVSHDVDADPRFSYLEKPKPIRAPQTLKESPISLVAGTGAFPAVSTPKAGTSYNPVFEDWDQLLVEEGQKAIEAEKRRLKEAEIEKKRQERIATAQDENENIKTEDESAWEGFDSEYESASWLKKRRPERKTPTERNKAKKRKAAERQRKSDLLLSKWANQAQQIKKIAKNVEAEAKMRAIDNALCKVLALDKVDGRVLRRRRLGKHLYVDMLSIIEQPANHPDVASRSLL